MMKYKPNYTKEKYMGISGDYSFWFTKVDENDTALPGALFALYISLDFSVGAERFVYSATDGIAAFNMLPEGTFYVQEAVTPPEFTVDDTIYKVILTKTGYDIYYGKNFEKKLSDVSNKITNRRQRQSVSVKLAGTKNLTGRTLAKDMFSFIVTGNDGSVVATGMNNASGSIDFSEIDFETAGVYTLTIAETKGTYSRMTYDTAKFTATVTITDDGRGKLKADVFYPNGNIVFNNKYAVEPVKKCNCPARKTKCRKSIEGKKIWVDNDNAYDTRPINTEIVLLRDGERYKNIILDTAKGDETFIFCCIPIRSNAGHEYDYQIDEVVPIRYTKIIQGFDVINTLEFMSISGIKTWDDNHNAKGIRPLKIIINLLQNSTHIRLLELGISPDQDTVPFYLAEVPFADSEGKPYVYTISEDAVAGYTTAINGFNITNTIITGGFAFNKTSIATGMSLQGAIFEIRQNGALISTSLSDAEGKVSFADLLPGTYLMAETVSPIGYLDNTDIYEVIVATDGTVTIDGKHADEFSVKNTPEKTEILLERATAVEQTYMAAPNTWPLHGTIQPDLYMFDKILITLPYTPVMVKWAYGIQDEDYFRAGDGIDITATYQDGFPAPLNTDYTVYAKFGDGTDTVASITIDRLRDGSAEMPYLLIDFSTADALEPLIPGINQFTLNYMQGDGVKLTQHYEIYEDIEMEGKTWEPIGPLPTIGLFTGSLYGNGNAIKNLALGTYLVADYIGLFRFLGDGASIQSLSIENGKVESYYASGFAFYTLINNGGTVILKDLHFNGTLEGGICGGIAGFAGVGDGSLVIDGCTVNGDINSTVYGGYAGGIVSNIEVAENGSLSITNCYSSGTLKGTHHSSGIIGHLVANANVEISGCISAMTIENPEVGGGILGLVDGSGTVVISSCFNKGNITGSSVGGIVGTGSHSTINVKIINSYNGGTINATSAGGGIYGSTSGSFVAQNCYNTGSVFSTTFTGGVSGNFGTIENCAALSQTVSSMYYTARISPYAGSVTQLLLNNVALDNMLVLIDGAAKTPLDTGSAGTDGMSETAAVLKTQAVYENTLGWDFNNIWSFGNDGYTLPILRGIPADLQPDILPPHLSL